MLSRLAHLEDVAKCDQEGKGDLEFEFYTEVHVQVGKEYQFKFRIGEGDWWVLDEEHPTVTDDAGNRNNLLLVPAQEHEPQATEPQLPPAADMEDAKSIEERMGTREPSDILFDDEIVKDGKPELVLPQEAPQEAILEPFSTPIIECDVGGSVNGHAKQNGIDKEQVESIGEILEDVDSELRQAANQHEDVVSEPPQTLHQGEKVDSEPDQSTNQDKEEEENYSYRDPDIPALRVKLSRENYERTMSNASTPEHEKVPNLSHEISTPPGIMEEPKGLQERLPEDLPPGAEVMVDNPPSPSLDPIEEEQDDALIGKATSSSVSEKGKVTNSGVSEKENAPSKCVEELTPSIAIESGVDLAAVAEAAPVFAMSGAHSDGTHETAAKPGTQKVSPYLVLP